MELKDVKFETVGEAAKAYPQSTIVIRKQFFDGVVARFQDTIRTRTEMLVEEQKLRVKIGKELQKEYHKTFELKEEIRKQKYRRCLAMAKACSFHADDFQSSYECTADEYYKKKVNLFDKWAEKWLNISIKFKQPTEYIEKDLETL